jgi:putative membrane protein
MRRVMLALSLSLAAAAPAVADTVPEATRTFIDKAAVANQYEIDTSQLALKYGKEADVKTFAQQMIDDHTKAGQELKASLAEAKIEPPKDGLDITHTAKYAKLRVFTTESGFDSAYTDEQLAAHKDAVGLFKDYSANGPEGPVKSFAQKTLPTLEHHLMMVEGLHDKMNAKSGATGASSGTTGDTKQ